MNEQLETEQVDTTTPEQVQADMSAGFNKVRGNAAATEDAAKAADTDDSQAAPPAELEPEPIPEPVALTQDELRAALAKVAELDAFRGQSATETQKLHGKIGELNRTLQAVQSAPTAANSEAHKAALQKLTDEYPELAETLTPLFGAGSGGGVSKDAIAQIVQEQVGQIKAETTQTIGQLRTELSIAISHPDYKQIGATPEHQKWLATKPADFQKAYLASWDPDFISESLTEFKTWKNTTYAKEKERTARLEGAVRPAGVPGRSQAKLPDSAGLSTGFNRVRNGGR